MKKYIIALGVLCLCLELVAQSYPKKKNAIRILTYNTHYCKGASDPGEIAKENIEHLAQIIKTLDADIVALQELDSASVGRGNRYLLKDIADATGWYMGMPIHSTEAVSVAEYWSRKNILFKAPKSFLCRETSQGLP